MYHTRDFPESVMPLHPRIRLLADGSWGCESSYAAGAAETPERAYLAWMAELPWIARRALNRRLAGLPAFGVAA